MDGYPQRVKHGFDGTLLDESGRRQDPHFTSDYRQWFQVQAPGKNPDATGIWWNDHGAGVYKLDEKLHPTYWTGEMACNLISHYDPESLTVRMIRRNVFWICMITSMFPTRR